MPTRDELVKFIENEPKELKDVSPERVATFNAIKAELEESAKEKNAKGLEARLMLAELFANCPQTYFRRSPKKTKLDRLKVVVAHYYNAITLANFEFEYEEILISLIQCFNKYPEDFLLALCINNQIFELVKKFITASQQLTKDEQVQRVLRQSNRNLFKVFQIKVADAPDESKETPVTFGTILLHQSSQLEISSDEYGQLVIQAATTEQPNTVDDLTGKTSLHHLLTVPEPNLELIKILATRIKNFTLKDRNGMTTLDYAENCEPAIKQLIYEMALAEIPSTILSQEKRIKSPSPDILNEAHQIKLLFIFILHLLKCNNNEPCLILLRQYFNSLLAASFLEYVSKLPHINEQLKPPIHLLMKEVFHHSAILDNKIPFFIFGLKITDDMKKDFHEPGINSNVCDVLHYGAFNVPFNSSGLKECANDMFYVDLTHLQIYGQLTYRSSNLLKLYELGAKFNILFSNDQPSPEQLTQLNPDLVHLLRCIKDAYGKSQLKQGLLEFIQKLSCAKNPEQVRNSLEIFLPEDAIQLQRLLDSPSHTLSKVSSLQTDAADEKRDFATSDIPKKSARSVSEILAAVTLKEDFEAKRQITPEIALRRVAEGIGGTTIEDAEVLIAVVEDINSRGADTGNTALHCACKQANSAMVNLLDKHGASWAIKNNSQKTPSFNILQNQPLMTECIGGAIANVRGLIVKSHSANLADPTRERFAKYLSEQHNRYFFVINVAACFITTFFPQSSILDIKRLEATFTFFSTISAILFANNKQPLSYPSQEVIFALFMKNLLDNQISKNLILTGELSLSFFTLTSKDTNRCFGVVLINHLPCLFHNSEVNIDGLNRICHDETMLFHLENGELYQGNKVKGFFSQLSKKYIIKAHSSNCTPPQLENFTSQSRDDFRNLVRCCQQAVTKETLHSFKDYLFKNLQKFIIYFSTKYDPRILNNLINSFTRDYTKATKNLNKDLPLEEMEHFFNTVLFVSSLFQKAQKASPKQFAKYWDEVKPGKISFSEIQALASEAKGEPTLRKASGFDNVVKKLAADERIGTKALARLILRKAHQSLQAQAPLPTAGLRQQMGTTSYTNAKKRKKAGDKKAGSTGLPATMRPS